MTPTAPRIFILYAHKDADDFADDLRSKLINVFGEQQLCRDRDKMEDGDALESVEFMVLIATPAAMASEIVRQEWRYARQQGVCVYPVQVPGQPIDFSTLPRWMCDAHFYDLTREWDTFIGHLHAPCHAERVPFMAQPEKPITPAPTPAPPVPDKKKLDPTILAAYIGGIFLLVSVVITGIFGLWQGIFANTNLSNPTPISQATLAITETPTEYLRPTQTQTIVPSHAPTILPTAQPTPSVAELFAHETHVATLLLEEFSSVDHNKDWTPKERDFHGVTMVLVPMGTFDFYTDPQTSKQINMQYVYWIDKTEVSNQAYQICVEQGDCTSVESQGGPQNPVVNVSWHQAADFCEMRGARLPSEVEWVYAASGPDSQINIVPTETVYNSMRIHEVAEEGDMAWIGALHMRGNMREWTDTRDPDNPDKAIVRGASYSDGDAPAKLSYQASRQIDEKFQNIGFRCVRDITGGTLP